MASEKMKIEVWTDIMCPYCYIGKIHYEKALKQFDHADEVEIEWKAFQLNPDLPDQGGGYPVDEYLMQTAGLSRDKVTQMHQAIRMLAEEAGVKFNLPNAIAANTHDAHRLIKLAATRGLEAVVLHRLSKAYFEEAKDYSDRSLLLTIGIESGLEESEIVAMLQSDDYRYAIKQDIQEMKNLGFDTVPTFLMDRREAIIGSEPVDLFLKVLRKSYHNWKQRSERAAEMKVTKGNSCSADGLCEI